MSANLTLRRRFLKRAIAGAALPIAAEFGIPVSLAADGRIVVMGVGGAWGESVKQLIGERFEKQYGIPMALDSRPNAQQVAAIQAMRGKPSVDSVELGGPPFGQATALDLLDAKRTLLAAQTQYVDALGAANDALAALELAVGAPLPSPQAGEQHP